MCLDGQGFLENYMLLELSNNKFVLEGKVVLPVLKKKVVHPLPYSYSCIQWYWKAFCPISNLPFSPS